VPQWFFSEFAFGVGGIELTLPITLVGGLNYCLCMLTSDPAFGVFKLLIESTPLGGG